MVLRCAASTLVAELLDAPGLGLHEVARTRSSVHYATGDAAFPVLCVAAPDAVRLPNAVVTTAPLPDSVPRRFVVVRWWRPARPTDLPAPTPDRRAELAGLARASYDVLSPRALLGRGAGLTPEGDDVLAGALVAAHATGDPRLPRWRWATRHALRTCRTGAVSRGLLTHAIDGYAVPELADLLTALCRSGDVTAAGARLRRVGHSSGQALLDGVAHVLTTTPAVATRTHEHEGAA